METKMHIQQIFFVQLYITNNYLEPLGKLWCLWALLLISKLSWYKNMKIAKQNPITFYILNCPSLQNM